MEALLEPGLQAFACGDEQAAAAGWSKCLGPRVCEAGRVYLLRDRAQVGTPSHPGRVLLRVRGRVWFCCRSTASVRTANEAGTDLRPGQAPFAPGAGAPTVRGRFWFFAVGAPPRCEPRTKRARICAPGRPHSHPGRVLLRVRGQVLVFCCRSTAPGANRERGGHGSAPRAGPIRTRGRCPYGSGGRCWFFA